MGNSKRVWLAIGLVIVGGVAWLVTRKGGSSTSPATSESGSADPAARPTPSTAGSAVAPRATAAPPTLPAGATAAGSGQPAGDHGIGFAIPGSLAKIPDRYEITRDGRTVFVNLAGGPSKLFAGRFGDEQPAPPDVTIRGRVVNANDQPVAGATVVFADQIFIMAGHLSGRAAAQTDAQGTFSVATQTGGVAIALAPDGWSDVVTVGTTPIVLHMRGRGALEGRITANGAGESFELSLELKGGEFRVNHETDRDGRVAIASLPPGNYAVSVGLAQEIAGGTSRRIDRSVTIEAGKTARLDIDQRSGTVIVVTPVVPDGYEPGIVQYFQFNGDSVPADLATIRSRAKAERAPGMLLGGQDARVPNQFHDVPPGSYVICVAVDTDARSGCAPVRVQEGDTARELSIQTTGAANAPP